MRATYSPEDNKLRIYPDSTRLDSILGDEYPDFKKAGWKWAAKQECFVCPRWTPTAEDWALRLLDDDQDIEDEDYSALDRSADRAERFGDYRDKRRGEAGDRGDQFESGPAVFGHQNQARAERQAARHDRLRVGAVSCWRKAEYWQQRTAGVIRHALHIARPDVRRARIARLEAEQRKHEAARAEAIKRREAWQKVLDLDGAGDPLPRDEDNRTTPANAAPAGKLAYTLANYGHDWGFQHPRKPEAEPTSIYNLLTDHADPLTPAEAAALVLDRQDPADESTNWARWSDHYARRLEYERAMLENEGGSAKEAEMEPGGWIDWRGHWPVKSGRYQIQKINKTRDGRVSSVAVHALTSMSFDASGKPWGPDNPRPVTVHTLDVTRLPADAYTPPTDGERAEFAAAVKARKAARPKTTAPALLNPTDEDAERLQELWNVSARARHEAAPGSKYGREFQPSEVLRMTQAQYSAASKGSYARLETRTLHACGRLSRRVTNMYSEGGRRYDQSLGVALCKIRTADPARDSTHYTPRRVVILTDKPQKPLPLNWATIEAEQTAEALH